MGQPQSQSDVKGFKGKQCFMRALKLPKFLWGDLDLMTERREQTGKVDQDMKLTGH